MQPEVGCEVNVDIQISCWDCWAPGSENPAQWLRWSEGGAAPAGEGKPDLPDIKPMQRRRLSPVARAAFHAAGNCLSGIERPASVFTSTYGQPAQTLKLMESIARREAVSPAGFSLSVHNSIAGLFSIIHGLTGPSITISAGAEGISTSFLEAAGLLAEGAAHDVLVVCFEEVLPAAFRPFEENPPAIMATCALVSREADNSEHLRLERLDSAQEHKADPFWLQMRNVIAFLESEAESLSLPCRSSTWRWSRVE